MPELKKVTFGFLEMEYFWHNERSDTCGSRISKSSVGPDWAWLQNPTILYAYEDVGVPKFQQNAEWQNLADVEKRFDAINSAVAVLKDQDLAVRLQKEGGVCTFMGDTERGFVLLLWVGKTPNEVAESINAEERKFTTRSAQDILFNSLKILYISVGEEHTRLILESCFAKAKSEVASRSS